MIDINDYTDKDELLDDLNERAWDTQESLVTRCSSRMAHIPSPEPDKTAICKNRPESGRESPTSTYPEGWRDGLEWCPYCLTKHYLDLQLEEAKRRVREDMERHGEAVIRAGERKQIYHTRECGLWPTRVRAATNTEVESLQQCERCVEIERGDYEEVGGGGFLRSVVGREGSCRTPLGLVPAVVQKQMDAASKP